MWVTSSTSTEEELGDNPYICVNKRKYERAVYSDGR